MKTYDITKTINPSLPVWPGDATYERISSSFEVDDIIGHTSCIKMSLHMGTHVDAHYHYNPSGAAIHEHDIARYIGPCQVIDVTQASGLRVIIEDVITKIQEPRVLFKTKAMEDNKWHDDFKGLSINLIESLGQSKVQLIGMDSPSVDPFNSTLEAHHACFEQDIYILENLDLSAIDEGIYHLVALPLKIEGADGSPVRAILQKND